MQGGKERLVQRFDQIIQKNLNSETKTSSGQQIQNQTKRRHTSESRNPSRTQTTQIQAYSMQQQYRENSVTKKTGKTLRHQKIMVDFKHVSRLPPMLFAPSTGESPQIHIRCADRPPMTLFQTNIAGVNIHQQQIPKVNN